MSRIFLLLGCLLLLSFPAQAYNFPLIPAEETLKPDFYNSQLIHQEQVQIFALTVLLLSIIINLVLLVFYWNFMLLNRQFDERITMMRLALNEVAYKADLMFSAIFPYQTPHGLNPIRIPAQEEEMQLEIIKSGV